MSFILYRHDRQTNRFCIECNGTDYWFTFDPASCNATNWRDENNKLVARTYKGFKKKLGIASGSSVANALIQEIGKAKNYL